MLPALLLSIAAGPDIQVSAYIDGDSLDAGATHEIVVEFALPANLRNANDKIAPLIQIDVPAGVTLEGRELTAHEDLARNEFLQLPYERAVAVGEFPARIPFHLERDAPDATVGISLVAYLVDDAGEHSFLRRRLELPLAPGAEAREGDAADSSWGKDETLLQIGQRAADFELPRGDGSPVALTDYIGDKNIIVTTYRAYW